MILSTSTGTSCHTVLFSHLMDGVGVAVVVGVGVVVGVCVVPAAHVVHVLELSPEHLPATHVKHALDPELEY